MKTVLPVSLAATALLFLTSAVGRADSHAIYVKVTSPDHPNTWVAGAQQQASTLRWDASRKMLMADVKYSTAPYADSVNPAQSDDHTVAFPNVHLAANGRDLIATDPHGDSALIGHLSPGLFGTSVALRSGTDFAVHRLHGRIMASLTYNSLAQD